MGTKRDINLWTGPATGHADPDDPSLFTTAWSVREGVEILDAQVVEKTMLVIRFRATSEIRGEDT